MSVSFKNRTVIITGAAGGLGVAYARAFADRGARLVLNDLSATGPIVGLVEELRARGAEVVAVPGDITDPAIGPKIVETGLDAFGSIDALINNAGLIRSRVFKRMTREEFEAVVAVHLHGTAFVSQAAFAHMVEAGYGRIVMTTSAGGLYGAIGVANYGSAKMAQVGLMHVLAIEGARHDVKVNAIAPVAASPMAAPLFDGEIDKALSPEWVAPAVLYLASEACERSGDIIVAAGGHYARAQILESRGVDRASGDYPTPEEFADMLPRIRDMEKAAPVENLAAAIRKATKLEIVTPDNANRPGA